VVSSRAVAKIILVATAVVGLLYFLYLIRQVVGAVFIALFLAVALGPAVEFLTRRRFPRALAILTVYVGLMLTVFGLGMLVVPPIVSGVNDFVDNVPSYVEDLRDSKTFREYDDKYDITPKLKEQADELPQRLGDAASGLRTVTVGVFGAIIQLVTILVMTFFILLDGKRMLRFAIKELGDIRGRRAEHLGQDIYRAVGGYVAGNLAISLIAGLSSYVVMKLLGIPFAVPLAVLMAFLDLIPLVGSAIGGAIIAVAAAIVGFPTDLIIWGVFFIIYQQVENNLLQPLIYKRTVAIHPLLVIVAVLIGASLLGVLGALLAIPVAATVQIVVKDWWEHREPSTAPPPVDPATGTVAA
jgi:predicted PurR-regulated permease PerM